MFMYYIKNRPHFYHVSKHYVVLTAPRQVRVPRRDGVQRAARPRQPGGEPDGVGGEPQQRPGHRHAAAIPGVTHQVHSHQLLPGELWVLQPSINGQSLVKNSFPIFIISLH